MNPVLPNWQQKKLANFPPAIQHLFVPCDVKPYW